MRARNAIFCPDIAAAVVGASAVVAMSAAPPITVSRHCLPVVKLITSTSSPFLAKKPLRSATIETPEIGDWFCASLSFSAGRRRNDAGERGRRHEHE